MDTTTTQQLSKQIQSAEEQLNSITKLSWLQKRALKQIIKKTKKDLEKELTKSIQNENNTTQLDQRLTNAILEMKEHFTIEIEQYNNNKQEFLKNGQPLLVEATKETLQKLPLKNKIQTYEQILDELKKIA